MISYPAQRGFTLIETIVYLALFSILIGGAVISAFQIFDTATRSSTRTMLQDESDFILGKIDWTLSGAKAVTTPAAGASGSTLTVAKWDSSEGDPIIISNNGGGDIFVTRTPAAAARLNNSNTTVDALTFIHTSDVGPGADPEAVTAVLTLSALTPIGSKLTHTATTTIYLRN